MGQLDNRRRYGKVIKLYLTFTAITTGTFTLTIPSKVSTTLLTSVSYSTNNGATWTTTNNISSKVTITTPTISAGNKVLWKGIGKAYAYSSSVYSNFSSTGTFNVSGNIMSLLKGDSFSGTMLETKSNIFLSLFSRSKVVSAEQLIFPSNVQSFCYCNMFTSCTSLTTAPLSLPAKTLKQNCYDSMFLLCTSLTTAPLELPATTLATSCFESMFSSCSSLSKISFTLPATKLATYCFQSMFYMCTGLKDVPSNMLSATTLAEGCCRQMFYNCTSLTTAPVLKATRLVTNCYEEMFRQCSKLNYIKALFSTTPGTSYTRTWVTGVNSSGTFVKKTGVSWNVTGDNGVPSRWTVQTASS